MSVANRVKTLFLAEPVACISGVLVLCTTPLARGRVSLADYAACIDLHTLTMLFSLMLVVAGFREEGMLQRAACGIIARASNARLLSAALVACCFFGSMVVTNDVSLMVFVPLAYVAFALAQRTSHFLRTVVLQTVAANLGSSLSPVGNPQNIYLQSHYGLGLESFLSTMAPIVVAGGIGIAVLAVAFLPACPIERVAIEKLPDGSRLRTGVLAGLFACCLLCVGGVLPWWALLVLTLACAAALLRPLFAQVDYALLLTFVFFFVLVENLQAIDAVREPLVALTGASPFVASVAASQVISNVPAAVLLSGFTGDGLALLAGTNVGGLGTPVASLASLISLKLYIQLAGGNGKHPARTSRYLLFFTAVNVVLLAALCALVATLP